MHVEVEGENGFFPPIASNSYILHAIVSRRHGLRRPKKGIIQKNLKNQADVADKICFGST